jgi:hypothetical protein
MLVLLAMGVLTAGTYSLMKQNSTAKKSVKSIAQKKDTELLERRIKAYLIDIDICKQNFENQSILANRSFNFIEKDGAKVLSVDSVYQSGSLKIRSFKQKPLDANSFIFELNYEKLKNQLGGNSIVKTYKISATVDSNDKIINCYMNDEEEVTAALEQALNKICHGPGVISGDPKCTVMEFDFASLCTSGEAVKGYSYDAASEKLKLECLPIISTIGDSGVECPFGLKATDQPGVFSCFNLIDIIDTSEVSINEGDDCGVSFDSATNKIKLSCGACVPTCPPPSQNPADVCLGDPIKFADSCGTANACQVTGTKDCSAPECVPMGCDHFQNTYGPKTERGCRTLHDDCGNLCRVRGTCDSNTSTFTCLMCSTGPSGSNGSDGSNGNGCFLAGTEISLFNGNSKSIEKISKDDILMGTSGEPVKVESLISFEQTGNKYSINGSRFFVTGSHPFKTLEGWKAFEPEMAKLENPDLDIGQLDIGDTIFTETGYEIVSIIDKEFTTETVYNFQVDGKHEYIADKFQVHNKQDCTCSGMTGSGNNCSQSPKQYIPNQQQCASGKKEICGSCNGGF